MFLCLFLFSLVLSLKNLMLTFSFNSVSLHDVIVVMSAFKTSLHFCKLMLNSIKLNTSLLASLSHFADFFLLFSQLQINTFMFICELFRQSILKRDHEYLKKTQLAGSYIHGQQAGRFHRRHQNINRRLLIIDLDRRHTHCFQDYFNLGSS